MKRHARRLLWLPEQGVGIMMGGQGGARADVWAATERFLKERPRAVRSASSRSLPLWQVVWFVQRMAQDVHSRAFFAGFGMRLAEPLDGCHPIALSLLMGAPLVRCRPRCRPGRSLSAERKM